MNSNIKKYLFSKTSQDITNIRSEGQVSYGRIEINPNVYVIEGGGTKRLVDLLGLREDGSGKYYLTLRGIITQEGEEIWAGKEVIERLNSRPGSHMATRNMGDWISFARSYQKSYTRLVESKMRINALATLNEVNKLLDQKLNSQYHIEVRRGDLMNLVDPFMPVDSKLHGSLDWNMDDHLRFKVYGNVENQPGGSQAFVGNTFTSYARIQDVDADTLTMLQIRLVDKITGKVNGTWIWDKKWPHTTHQVGTYLAKGKRDLEGNPYSKFKVYQRMVSPWGAKGMYANGEGLRMIMDQTSQLAEKMSKNTYMNRTKLTEMIAGTIREELTGIVTTKQWQHEALQFENILSYIPEYLSTELQLAKDDPRVNELVNWLEKSGNRATLRLKYNMGLKGARLKGTESVLKMRDLSDMSTNEHLEALSLRIAYSMQDRILAGGQIDKYGYEESLLFTNEYMTASQLERMRMLVGHQTPTFIKSKGFERYRKKRPIEYVPESEMRLGKSGTQRAPILHTLQNMKIRDQITGTTDNLLKVQEIDFSSSLSNDYLAQIDPKLRAKATKGYIVTMNGLDSNGNLTRKPIGGAKFPSSRGESEVSWALLPTFDVSTGEMVDPLELLKNKVELGAKYRLSSYSHIRRFGLGELVGAYSLENLRKPGSIKYLRRLAEANKVPVERIQALVDSRSAPSFEMLKQFKLQLDLVSQGDLSTTVEQDIRRLLESAIGSMGMDVPTLRDRSGNIFLKNEHILRHLSEMVTITTAVENLDPTETAKQIATQWSKFPILGAVKQSKEDASIFFGVRAVDRGGKITALSAGDILFDPKRKLKIAKMAQHSIDAGDFRVAVVTMDFKDKMMESLGFQKEGDKWVRKSAAAFGDKAQFQAEYIDEGFAALTESGTRKFHQAILNNMEPGVDYTFKRPQGKHHSYRIWDPLEEKYQTVFTKEPIEFNRVAHTRVGDVRIFPHAGALGKAIASRGGVQEEVDMFLSLGELMSKSGAPDMMRQLVGQMGQEAEVAWNEAIKAGMNSSKADNFIKTYQEQLGTAVSFFLNNSKHEQIEANGIPVYNMGIQIRNLDADRQIHAFSKWGSWHDKVGAFMTETPEGKEMIEGMVLKGQSMMDSVSELGYGLHGFLDKQGLIPEGFGVNDLQEILYEGFARTNNPKFNTSVLGQTLNNKAENAIEATAKAIFVGTAAMHSQYRDMAKAESEAIQQLSLERSVQYNSAKEAFRAGVAAAIGTTGKENVDTILKALMAGLSRF